jgi:hypothetical protein
VKPAFGKPHAAEPERIPVRGVPSGWRDPWDDPGEAPVALRAEADDRERRIAGAAQAPGTAWQAEIAAERRQYVQEWRQRRAAGVKTTQAV